MNTKSSLALAVLSTALLCGTAQAGDKVLGAIVGSGAGAVIGHSLGGRDGAIIGSAAGALAGYALADNSRYSNPANSVHYSAGYTAYPPPARVVSYTPVYTSYTPVVYYTPQREWVRYPDRRFYRHERHEHHRDWHDNRGHDRHDYRR